MLSILLPIASALLLGIPYQNGVIGVKMELPAESVVVGTNSHPPYCLIASDNPSNAWTLRVDRQPNQEGILPKDVVFAAIDAIKAPEGTVTLIDTVIAIGDQTGWWNVLHHTNQEQQSIIGRLALPAQGSQIIFVTLVTDLGGWKYGQNAFMSTLQSITPLDPVALLSGKLQSLQAAEVFLDNLNEKTLRPLDGFQEWRRIQTAGPKGAKDIGYAFVHIGLGTMQDLEKESAETKDNEPTGIIVTFQSRFVPNLETGVVTDTDARYWMSWDGKDERWSSKTTRWLDKISATNSETGIRNRAQLGAPKPKLLVVQQDLTTNVIEPPFEIPVTDPWLPRALVWITGPLFATLDSSETFRWRCYDNVGAQKMVLRIDELIVNDNETKTLVSQFGEGGESTTTTFDRDGRTTKQVHPNKMVVTTCTKELIDSIWKPVNLW
jgi:hypothetical protein